MSNLLLAAALISLNTSPSLLKESPTNPAIPVSISENTNSLVKSSQVPTLCESLRGKRHYFDVYCPENYFD
jgi:hypothetical protein